MAVWWSGRRAAVAATTSLAPAYGQRCDGKRASQLLCDSDCYWSASTLVTDSFITETTRKTFEQRRQPVAWLGTTVLLSSNGCRRPSDDPCTVSTSCLSQWREAEPNWASSISVVAYSYYLCTAQEGNRSVVSDGAAASFGIGVVYFSLLWCVSICRQVDRLIVVSRRVYRSTSSGCCWRSPPYRCSRCWFVLLSVALCFFLLWLLVRFARAWSGRHIIEHVKRYRATAPAAPAS